MQMTSTEFVELGGGVAFEVGAGVHTEKVDVLPPGTWSLLREILTVDTKEADRQMYTKPTVIHRAP